jgi:hypothetical protein
MRKLTPANPAKRTQKALVKSCGEAQCFLSIHGTFYNFFHLGRNLCSSPAIHRELLRQKFAEWDEIVQLNPAA